MRKIDDYFPPLVGLYGPGIFNFREPFKALRKPEDLPPILDELERFESRMIRHRLLSASELPAEIEDGCVSRLQTYVADDLALLTRQDQSLKTPCRIFSFGLCNYAKHGSSSALQEKFPNQAPKQVKPFPFMTLLSEYSGGLLRTQDPKTMIDLSFNLMRRMATYKETRIALMNETAGKRKDALQTGRASIQEALKPFILGDSMQVEMAKGMLAANLGAIAAGVIWALNEISG